MRINRKILSNIKTITIVTVFLFMAAFPLLSTSAFTQADSGLDAAAGKAFEGGEIPMKTMGTSEGVATKIGQLLGILLSFIGILFFILMIYGGFTWMVARGNEQEVTKAKEIIISAIIGLVIVMSAYAITQFVGSALTETK